MIACFTCKPRPSRRIARSHPGRPRLNAANRGHIQVSPTQKNLAPLCQTSDSLTPSNRNGKEGVDGSSPSEGSAKAPLAGLFWYPYSSPARLGSGECGEWVAAGVGGE